MSNLTTSIQHWTGGPSYCQNYRCTDWKEETKLYLQMTWSGKSCHWKDTDNNILCIFWVKVASLLCSWRIWTDSLQSVCKGEWYLCVTKGKGFCANRFQVIQSDLGVRYWQGATVLASWNTRHSPVGRLSNLAHDHGPFTNQSNNWGDRPAGKVFGVQGLY